MGRRLALAVVGSLLLPAAVFAAPLRQSAGIALPSAPITINTVVKSTRGGLVHSVTLICTTATCQVAIYDQTTTGGTGNPVWEGIMANLAAPDHWIFVPPLMTSNGIEVEVTGAGSKAFVTYE